MADLFVSLSLKEGAVDFTITVSDQEAYTELGSKTLPAEIAITLLEQWDATAKTNMAPVAKARVKTNEMYLRDRITAMEKSIVELKAKLGEQ